MRLASTCLPLGLVLLACLAPQDPQATAGRSIEAREATSPRRITTAVLGDPFTLSQTINTAGTGSVRGVDEIEKLIAAGTAISDDRGVLRPQLAEAVPSLDGGLWKLFPDGRMETTWKIRNAARWHDGTPVTGGDFIFTLELGQDVELPLLGRREYRWIEGIDLVDARTITVAWKQPFLNAELMFTHEFALPVPKHILEPAYREDKRAFLEHAYWTQEFVGTGPFRVREFVRDSHMVLDAYEEYVLGRARLDEIQVKFIPDPNALVANIFAGAVDLTLGRGLSLEQALEVERQWTEGRMETKSANWIALYPQLRNPDPPAQAEAPFRRALLHAIDRQQITDALQGGRAPVADTELMPAFMFKDIASAIMRYPYDLQKATQLMDTIGYRRGAEGTLSDASGRRLVLEARTSAGDDLREKMLFAIADHWRKLGLEPKPYVVPDQLAHDSEYRATRPAFELVRQPFDPGRYHSSEVPAAEKRWKGNNRTGYANPQLDTLIDRYFVTIPKQERIELLRQIVHHLTENLVSMGIVYSLEPILLSNRLVNVEAASAPEADETWNAHLWDVR